MMRLPSIDPTTRTLIIAGYPNVGKSSFLNKITRANVDVQPYAFTTKSLFVGHMDYKYLRWQVVDTPGVLDKPLEERNTIEMQSITALAHLQCCVLYVIDISEQCGYAIAQQVALFESIKPLFINKPLVVAVNKVDVRRPEDLRPDETRLLQKMRDEGARLVYMSTLAEIGLVEVKNTACDLLLAQRVESKLSSSKVEHIINRVRVAEPAARAGPSRAVHIPRSVTLPDTSTGNTELPDRRRSTQHDEQENHGGAGVYSIPFQDQWKLKRLDWLNDCIPEIMDGKNILDFVDPEIDAKLAELEAEEDERRRLMQVDDKQADGSEMGTDVNRSISHLVRSIRKRKGITKEDSRIARNGNRPTLGRAVVARTKTVTEFVDHMMKQGIKSSATKLSNLHVHGTSRRSGNGVQEASTEVENTSTGLKRGRSESTTRCAKRRNSSQMAWSSSPSAKGLRSEEQVQRVAKLANRKQFQQNKQGRASESDRRVPSAKPRHLYTGKRKAGKTDRR